MSDLIGLTVAALFTMIVISSVFKDNRFFKFAEFLFAGATVGHFSVMAINNIRNVGWTSIINGQFEYIIAIILGILLITSYTNTYKWVSRYAMAVLVGLGTGLSVRIILVNVPNCLKNRERKFNNVLTESPL